VVEFSDRSRLSRKGYMVSWGLVRTQGISGNT
jgi:hypothetical protein